MDCGPVGKFHGGPWVFPADTKQIALFGRFPAKSFINRKAPANIQPRLLDALAHPFVAPMVQAKII